MDGGMFEGGNVEGRLQEALNALGYLRRVSDGAMASEQAGGLSYDVPHRWTHAATGGGSEPVDVLMPYDVRLIDVGTAKVWCAYRPIWDYSLPMPDASVSDRAPWDCTISQGTLKGYEDEAHPDWVELVYDDDLQAASAANGVCGISQHAWANGGLNSLEVVFDATMPNTPTLTNNSTLWLPFAYSTTEDGRRVLKNSRRGALSNTLGADTFNLCVKHSGSSSSGWVIAGGGTYQSGDVYALTSWYSVLFSWAGGQNDSIDLRSLGLAKGGCYCVLHAADHLAGVL